MEHEATPQWIIFARHLVGWAALTAVRPWGQSTVTEWLLGIVALVIAAFILAGLWSLFFTAASKGRLLVHTQSIGWVLAILVTLGAWSGTQVGQWMAWAVIALGAGYGVKRLAAKRR